jgi:hypothetical protein
MLVVTVDNLSTRYRTLPTDVLARATTFDLYVANTATRWENRQRDIAEGKIQPKKTKIDDLTRYMDIAKKAHSELPVGKKEEGSDGKSS